MAVVFSKMKAQSNFECCSSPLLFQRNAVDRILPVEMEAVRGGSAH
jgi:hypothetical protein